MSLPAIPVRDLELPTRAKNALIGGGINTLADMMQWRVRELLTLPHCGPTTIEALRRVVAEVTGASGLRGGASACAGDGLGLRVKPVKRGASMRASALPCFSIDAGRYVRS